MRLRSIIGTVCRAQLSTKVLMMLLAFTLPLFAATGTGYKLNYNKPAAKWTEALPLGNGRIGAMVFGGTEDERIQVNESTLWGGGPHGYTNPDAYSHLDEVRKLIFAGKIDEAEKVANGMMGDPKLLMPYQPFCDLRLHFAGHAQAVDYHRELNLDDATAVTSYKVGDVTFHREVFISIPTKFLWFEFRPINQNRLPSA